MRFKDGIGRYLSPEAFLIADEPPDRDFTGVAEFAIPFAHAMVELRRARDANQGVTLIAEDVQAVVKALELLSAGEHPDGG